jgi:hypothetical protein
LRAGKGVSALNFFDEKGKQRASLGLAKDGPYTRLDDASGRQRVGLGVGKEGTFLRLDDENARPRVSWSVSAGNSSIILFDGVGRTFFSRNW